MRDVSASLGDRDLWLLEALSHQRVAVIAQAAHWLEVTEATAARRVRRLQQAGLVTSERIWPHGSPMVKITAAGLARVDSPLGEPGLKRDEYRHDVGVGWIWTAARGGAFGPVETVLSERQMRSEDMRRERMSPGLRAVEAPGAPHGVGVGQFSPDGRARRHLPDLVLRYPSGGQVAVELELTHKGARRLDRIMEAYASDGHIDGVLYLVADRSLADSVQRAAVRAGLTNRVCVRQVASGEIGGVPVPARARSISRARTAEAGRVR